MQSSWYLKPGQTLENTKIEDRGHALLVTKDTWGRIEKHLDRRRLLQEKINNEQARKQALKKGSEDLVKDWDNSMEKIRLRKEQERLARKQKDEENKFQSFFRMRAEQAEVKEEYINNVRKNMFKRKAYPRALNSAMLQTEVIYGREKQRELAQVLAEHEKELVVLEAQKIKEAAVQEKKEEKEKQERIHKKNLEFQADYIKNINDRKELIKKEKEGIVQREQLDIVNMEKEFEQIKQIEFEERMRKRADIKEQAEKYMQQQQKIQKLSILEDRENDVVVDIYCKAKQRMDCIRNKKMAEAQKALQARGNLIGNKIAEAAAAKAEIENRIVREAQKQLEEEELEKLRVKAVYKEQLTKERKENYEAFLKREEQRKFEIQENKKWEMLNRYKQDETIKQYDLDKKKKAWQKTLNFRKDLIGQMVENEEVRQRQEEEMDALYEQELENIEKEDIMFLTYADQVLDCFKNTGRTTSPIRRVINDYKKENNLPRIVIKACENLMPCTEGGGESNNKKRPKCPEHSEKS